MRKRELIIENEILKAENEMLQRKIDELRWDHEKLKYKIDNLLRSWKDDEQEQY